MRSKASIGSSLSSAGSQPSGPAEVLGPARAVSHRLLPVWGERPTSAPDGKRSARRSQKARALSLRLSPSWVKTLSQAV
eukprot:6806967-Alexandrium_andersonii.AAC.1